jgi:hypothetical protein
LKSSAPGFKYALARIETFSVIPKESVAEGMKNPKQISSRHRPFKFVEWQSQQRIVFERFP